MNEAVLKPSSNIETLVEIMRRLRDPNTGCPWDVEQNFETIAPYTVEEAYEVADAIERNDLADLQEELGDLLLQPVYHAQMAAEEGSFNFDDVVFGITQKLIRRHPHVFGDADARSAGNAKGQWERIKAEERAERRKRRLAAGASDELKTMYLDSVAANLPALSRAEKLQKRAAEVGFDWPEIDQVLEKVREEYSEFEATLSDADGQQSKSAQEEEFGDLLFALVNVGRHLSIDPEVAVKKANQKFRRRFNFIEQELDRKGLAMENADLSEMEEIWQQAKSVVG